MRFLYICPVCKKAYSAESAEPDDSRMCPVCAENLIYAGCDKTAWDQKSDEAKREYKDMVLRVFAPGSVSAAPAASQVAAGTVAYSAPGVPSEPVRSSAPAAPSTQPNYGDASGDAFLRAKLYTVEHDLHTIKQILVFFTVLWAIGIAILIIAWIAMAASGASLLDYLL